ncbi:hypothetical protein BGW38_009121 [Lunasporangiospora selenospora]|uniref:BolA protein n=1 Tax=Lunasporangiospora selenospora TaxID=979761 RepID=A0A9P6FZI0_9FUNG|nr:hypothetical protein BGW38_009121 [Lunasporangiospora selenospora]
MIALLRSAPKRLALLASPSSSAAAVTAVPRFFSSTAFNAMSSASSQEEGPVTISIRTTLTEMFEPESLEIINDSSKHAHHSAMRGVTSKETHFRVNVVSNAFAGKSTMQRHRMIYGALKKDFDEGLHALSLNTKTPEEIAKSSTA